jgi:hypothetical protein
MLAPPLCVCMSIATLSNRPLSCIIALSIRSNSSVDITSSAPSPKRTSILCVSCVPSQNLSTMGLVPSQHSLTNLAIIRPNLDIVLASILCTTFVCSNLATGRWKTVSGHRHMKHVRLRIFNTTLQFRQVGASYCACPVLPCSRRLIESYSASLASKLAKEARCFLDLQNVAPSLAFSPGICAWRL